MRKEKEPGYLNIDSTLYKTRLSPKYENRKPYEPVNPNLVRSYIPGTIIEVLVQAGQKVNPGDDLLVLDAMKMKNLIKCRIKGKIKKVNVSPGDKVSKGEILIETDPEL
ncbi:MAG: acetyl-CoA carboxylase biotin carboxyl carrier protein subunit [Bacteroidales bacterium]|nr:acetyl-CoA carboxylase biotin carboxyl carrier protein subunit [Bacteroidales bacterium]